MAVDTDISVRILFSYPFFSFYFAYALLTKHKSYLRSRKDQNVASSIEEGMRRTARDFDAFVAKNVTMEWEMQRQRIFEHFGLASKAAAGASGGGGEGGGGFNGGTSAFGASSFGRSRLGGSVGPGGGMGSSSVWAKSSMGGSVLGRSIAARPAAAGAADPYASSSYQGSLFADVDSSMQVELSRQVQLRQQRFSQAVKQLNESRMGSDPASANFPLMKTFGNLTGASGKDIVCFCANEPPFPLLSLYADKNPMARVFFLGGK